jgi:hypothetical protein
LEDSTIKKTHDPDACNDIKEDNSEFTVDSDFPEIEDKKFDENG